MTHSCDIVLPVYNGLNYVIDCIDSIQASTPEALYHLFVIDDCSDTITHKYLVTISEKYPNLTLLKNDLNLGFVKSCNKGIEQGKADYVLLINSDIVVVRGWLERLIACANSDPRIASVNPLTNRASHISIPIAPGANFASMDWYIRKISRCRYPDVVTGVGFCMLLRRSALDVVGLFDEKYGHGYCEDSDLCMRLTTSGYRTVVADDVYIFHKGSASFINRDERYQYNRRIFDQYWLRTYKTQFKIFKKANPLGYLRMSTEAPQRRAPLSSMRETYRKIRNEFRFGDYRRVATSAIRGIYDLFSYTEAVASSEYLNRFTRPSRLRVTYVLHNLTVAGGVLSVVQLVNELCLLGIEARIATLYQYSETLNWKLYSRPIIYENENDLIGNFPISDIAVATHWTTAEWVSSVVLNGKAREGVYFIQDYESWFFSEGDIEARNKVKATYSMITNKIVKSSWLQGLLLEDGYKSKKISLGIDLGTFYQRDVGISANPKIIAMARPRTPRRGFNVLVEALSTIKKACSEVDITLFGDDLSNYKLPFSYIDKGIVYDHSELAQLYSSADIFIDASDFQGFGRPALEAMACKTACVLTNVGGVTEYSVDGYNCLLVPPRDAKNIADSVFKLINNEYLRTQIINGGIDTVRKFSHKREAAVTLEYFQNLLLKK